MLLFLDIDGVMVPAKGWKTPEFLNDGFPAFSAMATRTLQSLLSEDVTIMLTTSHKSKFDMEEWKSIFKKRGINIKRIRSLPQNFKHLNRKQEIINWFSENSVNENFVILDDDNSLNDLPAFLKANLVQTSSCIGLTEEHLEAIRTILHGKFQPA